MPACGDDKKAIDDYTSEIGMGGRNTLAIYNTVSFFLFSQSFSLFEEDPATLTNASFFFFSSSVPRLAPRDSVDHRLVPPRRVDDPSHVPRTRFCRVRTVVLCPRVAVVHAQGAVDETRQGADQLVEPPTSIARGVLEGLPRSSTRQRFDQLYPDASFCLISLLSLSLLLFFLLLVTPHLSFSIPPKSKKKSLFLFLSHSLFCFCPPPFGSIFFVDSTELKIFRKPLPLSLWVP